jgi:hypothetical protein
MRLVKTFSVRAIAVVLLLSLFFYSCQPQGSSLVGVWKPDSLILSEGIKNQPDQLKLVSMTFELSKNTYYHFHNNNSFTLESEREDPNLKDAIGSYTVDGTKISIIMSNTKLSSNIIQLTDSVMYVKSSDQVTIKYKKIKND